MVCIKFINKVIFVIKMIKHKTIQNLISIENKIKSSLNDTGIAMLPGNAFGINFGYTTRFALTNFSHESDLQNISNENIKGMDLLNQWLNNL